MELIRKRAKQKSRVYSLESLEVRRLLVGDEVSSIIISEFMASNGGSSLDEFGESSDWIELSNLSNATVSLEGYRLTDDPTELDKWTFVSGVSLEAGERLVVWASGRDQAASLEATSAHTNFKLRSSGEYLALIEPDGSIATEFGDGESDYVPQHTDVSYGFTEGGELRFFAEPTPGSPNAGGTLGFVGDTTFSVDRGFFSEAFTLELASRTPGATLAYTLDGSAPSATNGVQVVAGADAPKASILIDQTSVVRAMAYLEGWESTNVDTQTYLFLEQVIQQTGEGLPDTWGHAGADYEMDPEVVNDPLYRNSIIDGLMSVPTLSLVSELDNWFGPNGRGIYPAGQGTPRPVSAELILANGEKGFQVDGSVEIQGGSSTNRWKSDKLSMQLKFMREFGDAKLRYPLYGELATGEFDTLILDARLNQAWHYGGGVSPVNQRNRAQYARDQFVADLQNQLGGRAPSGQWIHVYLNGIYWGIHNLHERPDEHFAAAYFGGSEDDYDVIKHKNTVVNGGFANYRALLQAVNRDTSQDTHYAAVEQLLDIDQFIDYVQLNYFVGNIDWAHHNWYATFNKNSQEGKWRYHSWDAEHVLEGLRDDATGRDDENGPTHVHRRLMRNADYRLRFMDAVQRNFYNDGLLTPSRAMAVFQARLDEVYNAVVPESARWGDNQRRRPFTRDVEWVAERNRLMTDYFPARTGIVIEQLRDREFFHRFDAPTFSTHGGDVAHGFSAIIQSAGDVYYTLDGSDPRVSTTRQSYNSPIVILEPTNVRVRAMVGDQWSAIVDATFLPKVRGDFSRDGLIQPDDIDLLFVAVRQDDQDAAFDLTDDALADERDVEEWITGVAATQRGDTNLDHRVDFQDFTVLAEHFGEEAGWASGDFSGDGFVTFEDFLLLASAFDS